VGAAAGFGMVSNGRSRMLIGSFGSKSAGIAAIFAVVVPVVVVRAAFVVGFFLVLAFVYFCAFTFDGPHTSGWFRYSKSIGSFVPLFGFDVENSRWRINPE